MTEDAASTESAPRVIDRIQGYCPELVEIRHDLHAHPEIGFEEVRTSGIVAEKLSSWGIEVHRNIGRTGVVGRLSGRHPGNRSVGLRADMDALPMPEETGLPYASIFPDRFHGCGHDAQRRSFWARRAIWRKRATLPAPLPSFFSRRKKGWAVRAP